MSRKQILPFQFSVTPTVLTGVTATASTDKLGKTAHGLTTGDPFIPTGFTGAAGITAGSRYYAILVDADNIKPATTLANALAGTAVDITTDGTGGILAKATKLQASRFPCTSFLVSPLVEGVTYAAYIGGLNSSGKPDPRTPITVANAAFGYPAQYDLSALWILAASGDGVDVFGFNAQPLL